MMKAKWYVLVVSIVVSASDLRAQPYYHLTSIGGFTSSPAGINNNGQILINSPKAGPNQPADSFLFSNGTVTDLGALLGSGNTRAAAINSSGQVAGTYNNGSAFLYSAGMVTRLGTIQGGLSSQSRAINASGEIVGFAVTGTANDAFLYANGNMQDLGTLIGGGIAEPEGINSSGQIVGWATTPLAYSNAFLYSNGTITDLQSFFGPGVTDSQANAINDSGQIVGDFEPNANAYTHAFSIKDGMMTDLGTFGGANSQASGVNNNGVIVGTADASDNSRHAFVYINSTMYDLNNQLDSSGTGWVLSNAVAINDNGWIVASASKQGEGIYSVLLTPIPEPSSMVLAGLAAAGAWLWSCRRFIHAARTNAEVYG